MDTTRITLSASALLALAWGAAVAAADAPRYRVERVYPVSGGGESWATDITDDGVVVGGRLLDERNARWSFVSTPVGATRALDDIPPFVQDTVVMRYVDALAANDATVIVGRHQRPLGGALQHAFVTFDTVFPSLLDPIPFVLHAQLTGLTDGPTPTASGMIAEGDLVGAGIPVTRAVRFLLDGNLNDPEILPNLGGASSHAHGLNKDLHTVGWSLTAAGPRRATLWKPGATDLGTLGGPASEARAITDTGRAVGWAEDSAGVRHAVRWDAGTIQPLPAPTGSSSTALDASDAGRIVGWLARTPHVRRATVWTGGPALDLNARIPPGTPWVLQEATAINQSGQIVGFGRYDGRREAFLLTPTCDADLTGDGLVNTADAQAFVQAFGTLDPRSDQTGDGTVNFADVQAFVAAFNAGC